MDPQYTGQMIARLRREKGWTQERIAQELHVSRAAVSKWECGLNYPDLALLEPLAQLLDTGAAALLGIEHASAETALREAATLSQQETASLRTQLWQRIALAAGVFAVLLVAIWQLLWRGFSDTAPIQLDGVLVNLLPLILGLGAWVLAGAAVTSGRKRHTDRWKHYSAASLGLCAAALYFPLLALDLEARADDWAAVEDTLWAYHYAAVTLLVITLALNLCAWLLNYRRTKK